VPVLEWIFHGAELLKQLLANILINTALSKIFKALCSFFYVKGRKSSMTRTNDKLKTVTNSTQNKYETAMLFTSTFP
jgi:hypothetical protein